MIFKILTFINKFVYITLKSQYDINIEYKKRIIKDVSQI